MPSADFCHSFAAPLEATSSLGRVTDLPGYCALTFTLMPAASTFKLSVQVSDFEDICLLIQLARLYAVSVRRASALPAASFRFHLAMDTLAVRLTIPPVGLVEDFHLQVRAPCRAHKRNPSSMRYWGNLQKEKEAGSFPSPSGQ